MKTSRRARQIGLFAPLREVAAPKAEPRRSLRTAGLFAGVGGLEKGLSRAGHETALFCEIDAGALAVLEARFPGVPLVKDVRELADLPSGTDLVTAGFPCQDLSQAGKTAGIEGARSGLVGEVFRLIEKQRVPLVLLENVPFMMQLSRGRALEVIVSALEELGYRWAYRVVDTRAFGIPQRRERVFLLAARDEDPRRVLFADEAGQQTEEPRGPVAYGFYWTEGVRGLGWAVDAVPTLKGGSGLGIPSPPAILLPSGAVVKPALRDMERLQGFVADWTKPAEKVTKPGHRWQLVGNAVTVDVAAWIGERLASPGMYDDQEDAPLPKGRPWPRAAWGSASEGRFTSQVSAWPVERPRTPLIEFLRFPTEPLSAKATAGFLSRTKVSSLRFPAGFLDKLERHLERMREEFAAAV